MICINANCLGTSQHLVFDPIVTSFAWVNTTSSLMWTWGFSNSHRRFEDIARLFDYEISPLVPKAYEKMAQTVWGNSRHGFPWKKILPNSIYETGLRAFLKQIKTVYNIFVASGYDFVCAKYPLVLEQLRCAYIDTTKLKSYLNHEKSASVRSVLASFTPVKDAYASLPVYDYSKTATGRSIMKSGPQILTLPSSYRDIIISSKDGHVIAQVDFISLEPRVALYMAHKSIKNLDVYEHVIHEIFSGKVTRKQAKLATLCALYGVSLKTLQKMMPNENAAQVVQQIKGFFGVQKKVRLLRTKISNTGSFHNYFGRPIKLENALADHVLFSRFVQSTAVDVSMSGFCELLQSNEFKNCDLRSLFVLHDALILEIPKEQISTVRDRCSRGISIKGLGVFPLGMEMVG